MYITDNARRNKGFHIQRDVSIISGRTWKFIKDFQVFYISCGDLVREALKC